MFKMFQNIYSNIQKTPSQQLSISISSIFCCPKEHPLSSYSFPTGFKIVYLRQAQDIWDVPLWPDASYEVRVSHVVASVRAVRNRHGRKNLRALGPALALAAVWASLTTVTNDGLDDRWMLGVLH